MLNGLGTDQANMALTKMWVVSQQTGALGSLTESPYCPSVTGWWGWTAVPRSWALQTWIEMAKYGVGTNTTMNASKMPRANDKHILKCCPTQDEQTVFKWPTRTGVR